MEKENSITFFIPMLPISVNAAYTIDPRRKTLVLTRKSWEKKGYMSLFVKKFSVPENTTIMVDSIYFGDWFYKNGKYRKVDGPNFDKMLHDVVTEKIGIDDSMIFKWSGEKRQITEDRKEGVLVRVTIMEGEIDGRDSKKSLEGNADGPKENYGPSWGNGDNS